VSRLVRLYPPAWRARYGPELEALLAARPPRLGDQVDLIFGAIDAHLHPELVLAGPDGTARHVPLGHRLPGLTAILGGLLFSLAYISAGLTQDDLVLSWIGVAFVIMLASLPGEYMARFARRLGLAFAVIALCYALAAVLPWGPNLLLVIPIVVLLGGGSLALATVRAGFGRRWRWAAVILGFGLPGLALFSIGLGIGWQQNLGMLPLALIVALYGIVWAAVGVVMTFRGSPTFDRDALATRERTA